MRPDRAAEDMLAALRAPATLAALNPARLTDTIARARDGIGKTCGIEGGEGRRRAQGREHVFGGAIGSHLPPAKAVSIQSSARRVSP